MGRRTRWRRIRGEKGEMRVGDGFQVSGMKLGNVEDGL